MKKFKKSSVLFSIKGFTLIELLVVVAIIAILAAVVVSSLSTAKFRSEDSAIKSDLANIRSQAELYLITNGTYGGTTHAEASCLSNATGNILGDSIIKNALAHANLASGGTLSSNRYTKTRCAVSGTSYAIAIGLKTNTAASWCIDNLGTTKQTSTDPTNAATILGSGTVSSPYLCGN